MLRKQKQKFKNKKIQVVKKWHSENMVVNINIIIVIQINLWKPYTRVNLNINSTRNTVFKKITMSSGKMSAF